MKVTACDIAVTEHGENPRPIADALQELPGAGSVHVDLRTDEGVTGSSDISFGRIRGAPRALAALIEHELKPLVLGTDPAYVRNTYREMLRETEYHGSHGLTSFAVAAIDTALWDCLGKTLRVPCWKLWGRANEKIRAYAMVGWLNYTDDEVREICREAVEQGFRAVKIKVGYPTLAEDIRRVRTVRGEVGDDVDIMVDANQSLSVTDAKARGRAFGDLGCLWWEEPIPADDIDGYAELTRSLDIPVAAGENLYSLRQFSRFFAGRGVDIIQPDLRRAGGPTALLKIGAVAESFGIPYASHGGGPVQLNVMASLPNAYFLETGLLKPGSPLELKDGFVEIPDGPGFSWAE